MSQTIEIDIPSDLKVDKPRVQKMIFIMNALEQGWSVKKTDDSYVFMKKHENRREVFQENYLETFVSSNFSTNILFSDFEKTD
jgi:hypothetical protein|uniref:Uncharacterized protein n=1 Tax=viral metagenome TaxID=1070528 RepID=A0A6C0IQB0_9ZZZZ